LASCSRCADEPLGHVLVKQYLVEADSIVKRFGEKLVLKAASLRVEADTVTALVGRNGHGKSTLLRIMCGVLQPDGGSIRLNGVAQESVSTADLCRRGLFYLPDRDLLHPHLTVRIQIETASRVRGTGADASGIANLLGISERIDVKPTRLSGGERRRAEFAVAIACSPRVLVADEPLRGISPLDAEQILQALRFVATGGCSVVLTGHEVNLILPAADRVYWCVAGTTREFASPLEALSDFAFRRDFMASRPPAIAR